MMVELGEQGILEEGTVFWMGEVVQRQRQGREWSGHPAEQRWDWDWSSSRTSRRRIV